MEAVATMTALSLSRDTEALPKPTKGERKRMSVADFVEAKFAAFDRAYGLTAIDALVGLDDKNEEDGSNSGKNKKLTNAEKNRADESDDDDDACVTLTYFALLTSLYLPLLLFLWIRRSVFGAGSLIRSLFLGHILRLILAFLLLPPSTTKTLVPTWVWNAGVSTATRAEALWNDKRVQGMIPGWVHICIAILLGTNETGGNHGSVGAGNNYDFPPALTALAVFTVLAFVVHPDGLTWIMLGRLRDGIHSSLKKTAHVIMMMKDGTIILTPSEISGTIAGFFIFYTIVRSILFPKNKLKEGVAPTPPREKSTRYKNKKGKKGRGGRNHHGNSGGGKGRIRGGHCRSAKDLYESPNRTASRSPSPCNRQRCDSDMEATTVSATSEVYTTTPFDGCKKEFQMKSKVEIIGSSSPLESREEDGNSCASSLATPHSNSASTQEGGKQNHIKGRGKKARKNASNDSSSSQQTERKGKKLVGFEDGSTQRRSNNTKIPFVSEEDSGDMHQTHQSSQPDGRSKKKSRDQRSKYKASNKLPKADSDFQGNSTPSFFPSPASPVHQHSDYKLEGQRTMNRPESPRWKGSLNSLLDGVSETDVAVSLSQQPVQYERELARFEQGQTSIDRYEATSHQYRETPDRYEETRNLYEGRSHQYRETPIRYEATINQYKATSHPYEATSHPYEAINNQSGTTRYQYEATSNQYEATSNRHETTNLQYDTNHNKYEATSNHHEMTSNRDEATNIQYDTNRTQYEVKSNRYNANRNQYKATSNRYDATPNQYEVPNNRFDATRNQYEGIGNQQDTNHLQYEQTPTGYDASPNRYEAINNQYETTLNARMNPIPNYHVPNKKYTYSHFDTQGQYGAGKQELAALFVEVQLPEITCERILQNIEDVNAFERLTEVELHSYGIGSMKCAEIKGLFEARRRLQMVESTSRQHNLMPWNTGISPPPGLVPNLDSAVTASEALSINSVHWRERDQQQSARPSNSPLPTSPNSECALSSSRARNLPQCNADNRVVNTATNTRIVTSECKMPVMPSNFNPAPLSTCDSVQNVYASALNSDAKIEADLQELGGQMAGSILDF